MNFSLVVVEINSFDCKIYGQIPQGLLHGFVPFSCRFWCVVLFGNLAWQSLLLRLGGCRNAIMGGFGNISFAEGSLVIVRQCFFTMFEMLGNFGWYVIAKTTLSVFGLFTFFKISFLSSFAAFLIAF